MKDTLKGQVAFVTGASRGIGAAIARILGQMGADVAINHLADAAAAAQVADDLRARGRRAAVFDVDVARREAGALGHGMSHFPDADGFVGNLVGLACRLVGLLRQVGQAIAHVGEVNAHLLQRIHELAALRILVGCCGRVG